MAHRMQPLREAPVLDKVPFQPLDLPVQQIAGLMDEAEKRVGGDLGNEFVLSILKNRRPLVDIVAALNMTVSGIVAHQSAMRDGEWLEIPQYAL